MSKNLVKLRYKFEDKYCKELSSPNIQGKCGSLVTLIYFTITCVSLGAYMDSKGPGRYCRLIWTITVHICPDGMF